MYQQSSTTRRIERNAKAKAYAEGIKEVVVRHTAMLHEATGIVASAAAELGFSPERLSRTLNSQRYLKKWWRTFKDELRVTRRRRRQARSRENAELRKR